MFLSLPLCILPYYTLPSLINFTLPNLLYFTWSSLHYLTYFTWPYDGCATDQGRLLTTSPTKNLHISAHIPQRIPHVPDKRSKIGGKQIHTEKVPKLLWPLRRILFLSSIDGHGLGCHAPLAVGWVSRLGSLHRSTNRRFINISDSVRRFCLEGAVHRSLTVRESKLSDQMTFSAHDEWF